MTSHEHLDLCPDCGGLRVVEMTSIGTVGVTFESDDGISYSGPAELFIGPAAEPCHQPPAPTELPRDVKVISSWMPACETGRHVPPHPDQTCDEADQWIAWRDRIIGDFIRRGWQQQLDQIVRESRQAAAAFQSAAQQIQRDLAQPPPVPPERADVQRALDILAPHLAWDHRYRP